MVMGEQTIIAIVIIAAAAASAVVMIIRAFRRAETGCDPSRCASCPSFRPDGTGSDCKAAACPDISPSIKPDEKIPSNPPKKLKK